MKKVTLAILLTSALYLSGCANYNFQSQITEITNQQIADANIPGAVILITQNNSQLYFKALGQKVKTPYSAPMKKDTIFDIASLSKPIATATSILILADRNQLSLEDHVADYLPAFSANNKQNIKIKHLLAHCSGLPSYTNAAALKKQFGSPCPNKVIQKICSLKPQSNPEEKYQYSCLGYIILGRIVEIVSTQPLNQFAKENIFTPLNMKDTCYNPPQKTHNRIAATELIEGQLHLGLVHDPLAKLMAGVSGNAGVFTTAKDLQKFCNMLLNNGRYKGKQILTKRSAQLLTTPQYFGRAYGFDHSSKNHSWIKGQCFQQNHPKTFCHSGYTGTSIVCDPQSKTTIIILTNRTHPNNKGRTKPLRTKTANKTCKYINPTP